MKRLKLYSICGLICFFQLSYAGQKDSAIYHKLLNIDFKEYINKPAQVFFNDLGYEFKKYVHVTRKPGYIGYVMFNYSDSIWVDIAVKDFGQKEPLDSDYKLDIEDYKTKKIDWICLRYGGKCIKGCERRICD